MSDDKKDAERYRWLRDKHPADGGVWVAIGVPYSPSGVSSRRNDELDSRVDAEIAQSLAATCSGDSR